MKPVILDFGSVKIHSYGLFVGLGFLVAFFYSFREARKKGVNEDDFYNLGIVVLLSAIIGARIGYVLSALEYYLRNPVEVFYVWEGGLSSFGGIIGGIIAGSIFVKIKKMNWFDVADSIALGLPLGFAIGRIGCFLNGCCYGIACKTPVSVVFPVLNDGLPRLPTQLFESAYSLVIFVILIMINRRYSYKGLLFYLFLLLYGLFRFFNEMIRVNPKILFGLSGSQLVSLSMVVASLIFFGLNFKKISRNGRE